DPNGTQYRNDFEHMMALSTQPKTWKHSWFFSSNLTPTDRHELFVGSYYPRKVLLYRIRKFSNSEAGAAAMTNLKLLHTPGANQLKLPSHLCFHPDGRMLVGCEMGNRINVVSPADGGITPLYCLDANGK